MTMITIEARPTAGGKLALSASLGELKTKTKYVVGGYPFYVVRAAETATAWKGGELVYEPGLTVTVLKRTRSRETAIREFRKAGARAAVLWASPEGGYELVARGGAIAPPE